MAEGDCGPSGPLEPARKDWETHVLAPALKRVPESNRPFKTGSGEPLEALYLPEPTSEARYLERVGFPGQYPFTRGIQPTMYRGRLWTMRQYAGFGTAEETNRRYQYLLQQGSTGLSVAFDLPTQIGYDSDDPLVSGEVGRVGVAVSTLRDMERLFRDIPVGRVSTSMTINSTAAILLAMYLVIAEQQGVPLQLLAGTIQNDMLKEYIARGTYRFPPQPSLRLTRDLFVYCTKFLPKWNSISVSGFHMREAGATAAQEIGFTLANAICYLDLAVNAGLDIDAFAPRLTFFFTAQSDLFEEIAKFRAARRLYGRLLKDRFHAKDPKSMMLRFHTQTSGVTLTAQQPENNVVRVAIQALAAVLGGTQSLHTNCRDEALALPSEDSVRLALRTQQVLAYESGAANTIDPLGGSYLIESLTDRLEAEAEQYIRDIEQCGGMVQAIEQGYVQRHIEEAAYEYGQSLETGARVIVGVNRFREEHEPEPAIFLVPEDTEKKQIDEIRLVKKSRSEQKVQASLDAVERTAHTDDNLMPVILESVRAYATTGEICQRLEQVFGEYEPIVS
ncbi:MAG: methylmalonyl-CoA mutase, N-terminal domain [Nitrospira sp.]|jgi:methylmalonyl-CoA mutase N-terminal domain/subunit|nr:methylmalonyl-CoA mutase, N-terminal domain [Nitrospira sp.]